MNRAMMLLLLLTALGATGCAAFQPRCVTRSIPVYWSDGGQSSMTMKVCGYDWHVKK